ncbi:MAG: hypothetical protein J0L70_23540 [Leptolyngbya sp. UWPOB_LEPTO1]|uniref:hypothetical protein n=1 Tax=Leptolyngbya sp. UWPOB_LEPTO1 TaxID=2815653 RepID=UPI001ACC431D|nr:hypothetical protein [Leptolyngbya sp. UWPOB_LEPTO1]MBN8563516.1 hypothetical protein [Leptolyngbya sp. UWPOB_LEPTO1]
MRERSTLFRPINQSLGRQPSLGLIPAHLLAPSAGILVSFYIVFVLILRLAFGWFLLSSLWGITSWWVVVGQKTWKFTHKFKSVPDWHRGHLPYHPCLREEPHDHNETSHWD